MRSRRLSAALLALVLASQATMATAAPGDPPVCFNGGTFVRVDSGAFVCAEPGPELAPLAPLTIPQMVETLWADSPQAVGILETLVIPIETGGKWNEDADNGADCHGVTQLCRNWAGLVRSMGYRWPQDMNHAWAALKVTRRIYDDTRAAGHSGFGPWICGQCSISKQQASRLGINW